MPCSQARSTTDSAVSWVTGSNNPPRGPPPRPSLVATRGNAGAAAGVTAATALPRLNGVGRAGARREPNTALVLLHRELAAAVRDCDIAADEARAAVGG